MTTNKTITSTEGRDLVLTRIIDAPREKVFQAWTDRALLNSDLRLGRWTTSIAETDVRVGGSTLLVMRGPDGNEFPNRGVYLEIVEIENERLMFTDAFESLGAI